MKSISTKRAKALAISPATKRAVYERDGGICVCCGAPGLPEAHYIARSRGGLGIEENILTLCRKCHDRYDRGAMRDRERMAEYFRSYLTGKYRGWNEAALIYRKKKC